LETVAAVAEDSEEEEDELDAYCRQLEGNYCFYLFHYFLHLLTLSWTKYAKNNWRIQNQLKRERLPILHRIMETIMKYKEMVLIVKYLNRISLQWKRYLVKLVFSY